MHINVHTKKPKTHISELCAQFESPCSRFLSLVFNGIVVAVSVSYSLRRSMLLLHSKKKIKYFPSWLRIQEHLLSFSCTGLVTDVPGVTNQHTWAPSLSVLIDDRWRIDTKYI